MRSACGAAAKDVEFDVTHLRDRAGSSSHRRRARSSPVSVVSTDDRVFRAGDRRVVVGPAVLAPRAIATWSE
jgi:hypothetical protein